MNQPMQQKSETTYTHIREAIGKLIDKGQSCIDEEKRQNDTQAWADDIGRKLGDCRKKWNEQRFQVAILALIKAGKSTLINSWLGNEFMPAATQPETARIVRVRHNPANERGTLRDGIYTQIHGAVEINDYLRKLNATVRVKGEQPPLDELILEASLVTLAGRSLGEQRFEILDTPGPNEAGVEDLLKKKIDELLDQVDVIIYLLDYTKLKGDDEAKVLAQLAKVRLDLLNSERLFFVVNKVDQKNRNSPELHETAAYVTDILQKQVRGLNVPPDRILLISAEQALLARLVESGKASRKALTDFSKKVFGELAADDITLEECQPRAELLLSKSRMVQLENTILSAIYSRRGTILLESLLGDLDRHLSMFYNNIETRRGALQANQAVLRSEMHGLDQDMRKIQARLKRVTDETARFQEYISRSVKKRFEGFRREVDKTIIDAFGSHDIGGMVSKTFGGFISNVRGMLGTTSSDRSQVEKAAQSLNKEVSNFLMAKFKSFMASLGQEIQEQQKPVFEKLSNEVAEISKEVEKVVGETLQINLLPVPLFFEIPPLVPLEQALGVDTAYETRIRYEKERYVRFKVLWLIPVYGERLVERSETLATHTIAARQIQIFWQTQISEMTKVALQEVDKKIEKEIRSVIKQAESELKRFSDNYVNIIKKGIEEASKGEQHRKAVLEQVEYRTGQLKGLLEDISTLKEALVKLKSTPGSGVSSKG